LHRDQFFTPTLAYREVLLHCFTPVEGRHIVYCIPIVYHSPFRCLRATHPIAFSYQQQIPPLSAPSSIIPHRSVVKCDNSSPKYPFSLFTPNINMALSPTNLVSLVVRGSISEGAGEAIGEAATNKFLEKHPLSRNAVIAIVIASVVALLLYLSIYLCCRRRRARNEKAMGRYQQMKLEREGAVRRRRWACYIEKGFQSGCWNAQLSDSLALVICRASGLSIE